jgi:protein-disulfide isomerase
VSTTNPPRPTAAQRRTEARATVVRLQAEQQRAARRARTVAITVLVACLALLGTVVGVILSADDDPAPALGAVDGPRGATDSGAIPVGATGAAGSTDGSDPDAVVVSVYADYLCPFCGLFEETNGPLLDELRESGDVVVEYHPISILDRLSAGSEYSTRSATAAALVADRSPEAFVAFNHALYADQPEENTAGLTDARIAEIAEAAGADDAVVAAIADGSYLSGDASFAPWVAAATERAGEDLPRLATPAVLIDGEELDTARYDWRQQGALEAAIDAARG